MSSPSAEETDYTMESLTWDSSFKAKLRSRAAIKVSLKPGCGGWGAEGRAMMRGKGLQVIHVIMKPQQNRRVSLAIRGHGISKMSTHTPPQPLIDSILFSHFKENRFTEE